MPLFFSCPRCLKKLRVAEKRIGKIAKCPHCFCKTQVTARRRAMAMSAAAAQNGAGSPVKKTPVRQHADATETREELLSAPTNGDIPLHDPVVAPQDSPARKTPKTDRTAKPMNGERKGKAPAAELKSDPDKELAPPTKEKSTKAKKGAELPSVEKKKRAPKEKKPAPVPEPPPASELDTDFDVDLPSEEPDIDALLSTDTAGDTDFDIDPPADAATSEAEPPDFEPEPPPKVEAKPKFTPKPAAPSMPARPKAKSDGDSGSFGSSRILLFGVPVIGVFLLGLAIWYFFFTEAASAIVTGVVTLEGEPQEGAELVFFGDGDEKLPRSTATTDKNGAYKLLPVNQSAGVPPGKYKVTVMRLALPDGKMPDERTAAKARDDGLLKNFLHADYSDRAKTPLRATIGTGRNAVNFELKKTP